MLTKICVRKRKIKLAIIQKIVNILLKNIKKVIEKMKDEAAGILVKEFVGLRSKLYSYCFDDKCTKNVKVLLRGL